MNTASNFTAARTIQTTATDIRSRDTVANQPKPASGSAGGTVRRLLSALMRSLATPHI